MSIELNLVYNLMADYSKDLVDLRCLLENFQSLAQEICIPYSTTLLQSDQYSYVYNLLLQLNLNSLLPKCLHFHPNKIRHLKYIYKSTQNYLKIFLNI